RAITNQQTAVPLAAVFFYRCPHRSPPPTGFRPGTVAREGPAAVEVAPYIDNKPLIYIGLPRMAAIRRKRPKGGECR
ncbi:MAG: hypothetical protein ACE1ZY_01920, partial [Alphaproteobacteria bacterium]